LASSFTSRQIPSALACADGRQTAAPARSAARALCNWWSPLRGSGTRMLGRPIAQTSAMAPPPAREMTRSALAMAAGMSSMNSITLAPGRRSST
jgi:hypothetical protein